jgi:microcin C transport system substrate-binding protein
MGWAVRKLRSRYAGRQTASKAKGLTIIGTLMTVFRISALTILLSIPLAWSAEAPARAQGERGIYRGHAVAMHGEPAYGPGFAHFDYVNPNAPKGGTLRLEASGTFDTLNPFNAKGSAAAGLSLTFETLLSHGQDEAFTEYGLIAESVAFPEDRSWVEFTLRPQARWHDGKPITVEDVAFSLDVLKTKGAPFFRFYYQSIASVEKIGPRSLRMIFSEQGNRELPLIAGQMPILPRHYWEGRDFDATTLEPTLGSGPYRVADFEPGRHIAYERVPDYWGAKLPVNLGYNNFERINYRYYRDREIAREALIAGNVDFFAENSAKEWATRYDVPAVAQGMLVKEQEVDESSGQFQGFFMNTRRKPFDDRKLREALIYAYDFTWTNEHIYFGAYLQPQSFFGPTELASSGLPEGEELAVLERFRGRVPEEVFTTPYRTPQTDGSGWPRDNLTKAFELLAEAGWVVRDMVLVNAETGQRLSFEFLYQNKGFERVILPYVRNLRRLGIDVRLRLVDPAQYINRIRAFDFDIIIGAFGQSLSPGNEQRAFWGSESADLPGSRNIAGIKDPAIDELIELVITAPSRESLIARTRALDRVLLWGHYAVPTVMAPFNRLAYWNKFGRPENTPLQGQNVLSWWFDPEKAEKVRNWQGRSGAQQATAADGEN